MNNEDNSKIQYNSCVSRGICSVNPRVSALQNVLGLYTSLCAKYCLKLLEKCVLNNDITDFILNISAVAIANPEFSENTFLDIIAKMKDLLPAVINKYNEEFGENEILGEDILSSEIFQKSLNITDAIKLGESFIKKNMENTPQEIINLYKILYITAKSVCINLLTVESFGHKNKEFLKETMRILSAANDNKKNKEDLTEFIKYSSDLNITLMKTLHDIQEARYGIQGRAKVSYTTTPSKAMLVVGTNIKELEDVLEAVKTTDIDIYTHDDMMLAHTFPKFSQYANLKGQYGHGIENCLIDFATFPGPIILTKYSLKNIENLYRGRLFTTDINYCKGVIRIQDNDFSEVIESANSAKGFKTGKICETVNIGYDFEEVIENIKNRLQSDKFKNIIIISLNEDTSENKDYFNKMTKYLNEDTLIISFSYNCNLENSINIQTCFDSYAPIRLMPEILKAKLPVGVFISRCNRDTLTKVIYFNEYEHVKIFLGNCQPIMVNPVLKTTLSDVFQISDIKTPKQNVREFYEFCKNM